MKKTILIDLDGVLNQYTGNFDEKFIPPIKDGAFDFVKELSSSYIIKIFTTRNLLLASKWVIENGLADYVDDVTKTKELSYIFIDDRCIKFDGDFTILKNQIENFEAWHATNKKLLLQDFTSHYHFSVFVITIFPNPVS